MNLLSSMVKTLPGGALRVMMAMGRRYVGGMLVTNHVLSGAVIGAASRRVVPAFALGVLSHFALDVVPHWGRWAGRPTFMQVAVPDGLAGLAVMGVMATAAPPGRRAAVLAGMAGAAFPDLDKPSRVFFGRSPFPRALDQFHSRIQREDPQLFTVEVAAAACFCAAVVGLLGGRISHLAMGIPGRPAGPGRPA
jgi:hypothetical protein